MKLPIAAVGLALIASCNQYEYRPEENATAKINGRVAAAYPIPPEKPQGNVRVAGYGIDRKQRLLHVRMIVENNSLTDEWSVDVSQLRVDLRDHGVALAPAMVTAPREELPTVHIPAGGVRTLDLYFPLDPSIAKASKLPAFDFVWRVQAGAETVAERTPFERMATIPYYYSYGPWERFGPYWAVTPNWVF